MSGLSSRYESLQIAKAFREYYRKIAVIVGADTQEDTQDSAVIGANKGGDVVAQRYRIRILGEDPPDKDVTKLPVAYPLQLNSSLGGQSIGIIRYPPNTYVYVSKDPNSGTYQIEQVVPNFIRNLLDYDEQSPGVSALSGFVPDTAVPESLRNGTYKNELFGKQIYSEFHKKEAKDTKLPTMPNACTPVNTAGVNDALDRLIKDIEELRTGLLGEDSFLQTSQNFLNDVQNFNVASGIQIGGEEYEISIGNAAQDISQIIAALMQEFRKWVIRKVSSGVNAVSGNVPLSTRYILNETKDKSLTALSCLFYRILLGLEELVAEILRTIIDKIINASSCLVENILGGVIGEILGRITGLINSILGPIGNLIGEVIDFTSELLDFAIDIIDAIKCPVKNICPSTDKWDFLDGSGSPVEPIDLAGVFNQAKSIAESAASTVGKVTATFDELTDDFIFTNEDGSIFDPLSDINAGVIWQNVIDGSCNTGAIDCGPPKVNFWGGSGSGGAGNAVINGIGEIIGVNIVSPGKYASAPFIEFEDVCGIGKGATGEVIIGPVTTTPNPNNVSDAAGDGTDTGVGGGDGDDSTTDITYDITDTQGAFTILPSLKDLIKITRYNDGVTGTEGHPVGSIGYYIDVKNLGDPVLTFDMVEKTIRGSGLIASDNSIAISSGYPQQETDTRFKIAFDMTNSLESGRQATYVRGFNITLTGNGIVDVVITDPGYGYENIPCGNKGGSGKVWADRCQTTVRRANYSWDVPYDPGRTIEVYYGDEVSLPGEDTVVIDKDFTEDKIPGCIITGTNPQIKDMTSFDYKTGKVIDTDVGVKHQFDFETDAQKAFAEGYTEQDVRFFLENKFFLKVDKEMRDKLLDPEWGKATEFSVTFTSPECPNDCPPNDGSDVVSELGDVAVKDGGFGYSDGDTISIGDGQVGDGQATGDLIIQNGRIAGVNITNPGIGFTTLPSITINTGTGFNADLKPVLRFFNPNDSGLVVPFGTPTLRVIDCVGKV